MSTREAGCHCLCAVNHPDTRGICEGHADTSLEFQLDGEPVHVSMCSACVVATLAHRKGMTA